MKLKDGFDSNYRYVLVAARRARQLQSGAKPLVDSTTSRKACRVAEQEIAAGKVKWERGASKAPEPETIQPLDTGTGSGH